MKKISFMAVLLSACLVFSGCGMTNTAKGGMIGGGGGAALGALVGGVIGHGKGADHRCGSRYCCRCGSRCIDW